MNPRPYPRAVEPVKTEPSALDRAARMTAEAAMLAAGATNEALKAWADVLAATDALAKSPSVPPGIREQARTLVLKMRPEVDVLASLIARA